MTPLVEELSPAPGVSETLHRFAADAPVLFDSSAAGDVRGRFSYLTAGLTPGPPDRVRRAVSRFAAEREPSVDPDLPPFRGGAVGLWCYEEGRRFETLPEPKMYRAVPPWWSRADGVTLHAGRSVTAAADWVLAWDHAADRAWVICAGGPVLFSRRRDPPRVLAEKRMRWVRQRLDAPPPTIAAQNPPRADRPPAPARLALPAVPGWPGVFSPFTRRAFEAAVRRAVEYIRAGDIFQVNVAQPLLVPGRVEDWRGLYDRLRGGNPAPFGGVFDLGDVRPVLSSSRSRPSCHSAPRYFPAAPDRRGYCRTQSPGRYPGSAGGLGCDRCLQRTRNLR